MAVAYRLSTIQEADTIHVLEQGRLVQSGSYEDLAREPGAFGARGRRDGYRGSRAALARWSAATQHAVS